VFFGITQQHTAEGVSTLRESRARYFDTHAHLTDKKFEKDVERVLERAEEAGVEQIINVGDEIESSRECVEMSRRNTMLLPAIGVHPHNAESCKAGVEGTLTELAKGNRVYAIGEIGLDYHYEFSPRDVQRQVFEQQLGLAQQLDLPVIMHCREAHTDLMRVLEKFENPRKGVAHCFTGSKHDADELQEMGYYIGVAGPVTLPNAEDLRGVIGDVSLNRILLETDSPHLAPAPKRGRRNEPSHIRYIANQVGLLKNLSGRDIGRVTAYNARRAFHLDTKLEPQIVYQIRNSLYVNMTNRCTNRCVFCRRQSDFMAVGHYLKLSEEPTVEQIIGEIGDAAVFDEVVFCGYGEPTIRLDAIKDVCAHLGSRGVRVRLDTNGHGSLINGRDICRELRGLVQTVSVSLNGATAKEYNAICRPQDESKAYQAVLDFARKAKEQFDEVVVSAVSYPGVDIEECRAIAEGLGARFRVRSYSRFL
jgi:TatD DNase family protein